MSRADRLKKTMIGDFPLSRCSEFFFRAFFILFWAKNTVFGYIVQVLRRLPIISGIVEPIYTAIIPVILILVAIFSIPYLRRHIRLVDLVLYVVCLLFVLFTMIIYESNAVFIGEHWTRILIAAVPMYFIGISFDFKKIKKDLFFWSLLGVLCSFLYQLYFVSTGRQIIEDNMDASYNVLPSILYLFYWAISYHKIRYWLISFVGLLLCFTFGTRGPLLICLIFVLGGILFKLIWSKAVFTKIFVTTVALLLSLLLFYGDNLIKIIEWLSCLVENLGMSTRIFDLFLEGEIANSSGRDRLAEKVITAILQEPIRGYGILGDWVITGHVYVHNIFLEIWCQFGLVLGTFILAVVIALPLYVMFKYLRKKDEFLFMFMLFSMVFVKLMLSGTYLTETYFFLLLGLSVGYFRRNRIDAVRSVERCV